MKIAVVDYGMGNLRSVAKALEHVAPDAHVETTSRSDVILSSDKVVFPGQGAMPDCMRELDARGLRAAIVDSARHRPFLGICIGLQMLFDRSEEGNVEGLGILGGSVRRFERGSPGTARLKVPHMGWNNVVQLTRHALWEGIEDSARFYFVHSYFAQPTNTRLICGRSEYGIEFCSAVARENIFAVQFHPEKSQEAGLRLLRNFIKWNP